MDKKEICIRFRHGLGDSVQLTAVLRHLAEERPDWVIDIESLVGKHTAYKELVRDSYVLDHNKSDRKYAQVFDLGWYECFNAYHDSPGTKTALCLREIFNIAPRQDLLKYTISVGKEAAERAEQYVKKLPDRPFVLIHSEGNTSQNKKNLSHAVVKDVCEWLLSENFTPVILDWDRRSPLPDQANIFCPGTDDPLWQHTGTGDAETLAAICKLSSVVVAIDSGPQKVAFAADVPTVAVWVGHHPYHYCDNAPNAIHLVPEDHVGLIRGDPAVGLAFFNNKNNYRWVQYPKGKIANLIKQQIAGILGVNYNPMASSELLTATAYDDRYYEEHKDAGLDYLGHGEWQINYGRWLAEGLGLKNKTVLDVGCACGSIAAGIAKAGALVSGIDCNEHMITLGRQHWLESTLKICDATNMHYWKDESFYCIHSNNVFEHFKPKLVPHILEEMYRVTKPGGILFAVLDTVDLYERQKRDMSKEDPTHICVKHMDWWHEQIRAVGWRLAPDLLKALTDHKLSYFKHYDWPCLIARKPVEEARSEPAVIHAQHVKSVRKLML